MAGDLRRDLLGSSLTALSALNREAASGTAPEVASDVLHELNPRNRVLHHVLELARGHVRAIAQENVSDLLADLRRVSGQGIMASRENTADSSMNISGQDLSDQVRTDAHGCIMREVLGCGRST
jgi:hypothetical protein